MRKQIVRRDSIIRIISHFRIPVIVFPDQRNDVRILFSADIAGIKGKVCRSILRFPHAAGLAQLALLKKYFVISVCLTTLKTLILQGILSLTCMIKCKIIMTEKRSYRLYALHFGKKPALMLPFLPADYSD